MHKFEQNKTKIINTIKEICKDNLLAVILYGSYVKGNYFTKRSDINMMIIRTQRSTEELIHLNKCCRKWHKKFNLSIPMVLTKEEIQTSTDVYPMEYLDIKENNTVLYGEDIFSSLNISLNNLRLELENQIKSKLIFIRKALITFTKKPKTLKFIILDSLASINIIIKNILNLNKRNVSNSEDNNLNELENCLDQPLPGIKNCLQFKKGSIKLNSSEIIKLYQALIQEMEILTDYVDKFKVG